MVCGRWTSLNKSSLSFEISIFSPKMLRETGKDLIKEVPLTKLLLLFEIYLIISALVKWKLLFLSLPLEYLKSSCSFRFFYYSPSQTLKSPEQTWSGPSLYWSKDYLKKNKGKKNLDWHLIIFYGWDSFFLSFCHCFLSILFVKIFI